MGQPNFDNRTMFRGDNLGLMRSMNSGCVHLIATDPPFNKGRDFHATPESVASGAKFQDRWRWEEDVQPEWLDQIQDDHPSVWAVIDWTRMTYGDDMAAFLCFMGVRLIEMRRVLREDGRIYLHCDPTASQHLKAQMDAAFGRKQFRNGIVWACRRRPSKHPNFQRMNDTVLRYTKTDATMWSQLYEEEIPENRLKRFGPKEQVAGFENGRWKPRLTEETRKACR